MTESKSPMSPEDRQATDRWLDVLAGRATPDSPDTQQAALLRQAMAEHVRGEDPPPRADPSRLAELLSAMEELAPESTTAASTKVAADSATGQPGGQRAANAKGAGGSAGGGGGSDWLGRLRHWLFPPGPQAGWRMGSVAAGVLGVAVIARLVLPIDDDEAMTPKSSPLPPPTAPAPMAKSPPSTSPEAGRPAGRLVLTDSQPAQRAALLRESLRRQGVFAELSENTDAVLLEARVPPDRAVDVQLELNRLGLMWPQGETLFIEIRRDR